MRNFLVFMFAAFLPSLALAAGQVFDTPITARGDTQTTSVTTYTWTAASELTNGDIGAQTGVFVVNYSTNSSSIGFLCDSAAPSEIISERWGEMEPGEWDIIPCGEGLILYLVTYGSSAQNVQTTEVRNTGF